MCRWLAYSGEPIFLDTLVVRPNHSLIDQSMFARENYVPHSPTTRMFRDEALPTNGDGFGLGWYGDREHPGLYRDIRPAWNDDNLHRIAEQVRSPLFLAHVRAAFGGTISRENCHPFTCQRWLWQYNGEIEGFNHVARDLRFDVDPALYPQIQGDADTETAFFLALTYGLAEDPPAALGRMIARVERAQREHGVDGVFRCTGATTDGETIYAWRYATDDTAKTLYYNAGAAALRAAGGDEIPMPEHATIVVSEPLELHYSHQWVEVPPNTLVIVRRGGVVHTRPLEIPR
ncbi:glutamine amidotransferase [Streptoalloteichus tenebrarius]|uniref:Glutamine amidotransferase n=1 Tax=Streptoalloteichus tenebrarius (strain ATCC 17920 / DSM 40477 / JCM 4838 / CBS 697.72 / NBRC 16177 / NCIMB 11028 / NRRL B-12390 / A12253. 1 / ISP 5477) TaxID=1933 RepID=A0ABT1HQG9_STRSD|nr:class II glutamine amidotransferase [Streptoalloteichus tenebrarius]MCP2257766.1 glutamine amidotransferase [Streptoalloteichus tenebrarius]BFE99874.1 class II glutamine amidotransferase [Streptoalloteichus tenebrarius]